MEKRNVRMRDSNNFVFEDEYEQNSFNQDASKNLRVSQTNWKDDKYNIALLLLLYILQGIPLGLAGSLPLILQKFKVSYKEQALFSFVHWPFSLKLLWAPIVDSTYWISIGRRKSWLIPTQYLIGITMIILSSNVSSLLGEDGSEPNVIMLTAAFFFMNTLAATQDIAVDGWALTMLSKHNVGYASTCNSVGQTVGFFLGNFVFLALESADFCNSYLRSEPKSEGIVTLSAFLIFWSYVFFIATTLVGVFKRERNHSDDAPISVSKAYKMLYHIVCLPNVFVLIGVLLTSKIGFAATDAATGLKLMEAGVKKEQLALLGIPLVPLQVLLPLVISRYTAGPYPLSVFLKAYPYRLFCGILFCVIVWWTYVVKLDSGEFPLYYYAVIVISYGFHQIALYSIFVAVMAFFAKISDPTIGGTYMTLLNTIFNLAGNWPATLSLWFLDSFTAKSCLNAPDQSCKTKELETECENSGGHCAITFDGYYLEVAVCTLIGYLWLKLCRPTIRRLQQAPASSWVYKP